MYVSANHAYVGTLLYVANLYLNVLLYFVTTLCLWFGWVQAQKPLG